MYVSVLVALDGSEQAAAAVPHGLAIARALDAVLLLVRVVPCMEEVCSVKGALEHVSGETSLEMLRRRQRDAERSQAEGYLAGLERSLRDEPVRINCRVKEGRPAEIILEIAKSLPDPLIVITASGRGASPAPHERPLGQVARAVLCGAEVPVLVVQ